MIYCILFFNIFFFSSLTTNTPPTIAAAAVDSGVNCGKPWTPPILHPKVGHVELAEPGSWSSWTVNICWTGDPGGEMECRVLIGLIVGNGIFTKWILTTINRDANPRELIVVTGANNYSDLINPKKVGVYLVRNVFTYKRPEVEGLPELSLLELEHDIIMSKVTKLAPICIPTRARGDAKRFNNTASWIVGWADEVGPKWEWINATFVQYYARTQYAWPGDKILRFYVETGMPKKKEFFTGTSINRVDSQGRWFTFALSMIFDDDDDPSIVLYERTEFICLWLEKTTQGDVQCVPYHE